MEHLIPVASKLQDVLGALGQNTSLDLPQIVVVGGQSSGKSSVLEAIVGRSFLPRGHGIVTRRPLVLQLYNTAAPPQLDVTEVNDTFDDDTIEEKETKEEDEYEENEQEDINDIVHEQSHDGSTSKISHDEWGEFLHLPGRRFHDFSAIRNEIVRDTDRLTGQNKGINPTPIHLKIYSPRVLALTLVDLPGMAKVAVGDQPADIEQQIRDMSMNYISNPNAIILAVTSANTDLANSDALQLAQQVDPYGERTLGVLTKLDLMDPGTDASDILHNKVIPLRKGYIGVVNRGQIDVNSDLSIREGLRKEQLFFRNHPTYGHDRSLVGKVGTHNLARQLNIILMHHIRECLPELKSRIINMMNDVQMELDALGMSTDNSSGANAGGSLLALLSKFSANFTSIIEGRGNMVSPLSSIHQQQMMMSPNGSNSQQSDMNVLFGGARISYIFNDIFSSSLMSVGAFDGLSDEEIRTTICNANGTRPALFVPEISFDILVRRQISRLEQPGIQCVDLVYEELQRITSQCEPNELTRFPNLRDRLVEVVSGLLKRSVTPTQMMVSNLIKIEMAYINTSHPDFIGGSRAVAQLMQKLEKEKEDHKLMVQQRLMEEAEHMKRVGEAATSTTQASSSSLNNGTAHPQTPQIPIDQVSPNDQSNSLHNDEQEGPGGLINFIFGGGKTPGNEKKSLFRSPPPGRKSIGPPSIVQLPQIPDNMRQTDVPPTDREKMETEIIKSLIESYFSVVRKNFIDMVPKTIMYFLVNHVRDKMQNELVSELYRDSEVSTLMQEAEDVAQRRNTCIEMKSLLTKALDIVNEVRDFNTFK